MPGHFIVFFGIGNREARMAQRDGLVGNRPYWVVVADEFQAAVYKRSKKYSELQYVFDLKNDIAREKLENLVSDRGGRGFDGQGQGRHTYSREKSDPRAQSYQTFARQIADGLRSRSRNAGDGLVVVAAPRFLGVMRQVFAKTGLQPDLAIDKEVTSRGADFIQRLIDQHEHY